MDEKALHFDTEICVCTACCRDFHVGIDEKLVYKMFCPNCQSPYLLEDEYEQEPPENLRW